MNIMLLKFVKKVNILLKKRSKVYLIMNINKKLLLFNNNMIDQETEEIRLRIKLHINNMIFNIIAIKIYNIMLKLS